MSEEMKGLVEKLAETIEQLPEEMREQRLREYIKRADAAKEAMEIMAELKGA